MGLTPVLVEIPVYGIEHLDEVRSPFGILRERLYRFLFDGGEINGIASYRAALRLALEANGLTEKCVLVEGARFIEDYEVSRDLYRNVSHLNDDGSRRLARIIAESILEREAMRTR